MALEAPSEVLDGDVPQPPSSPADAVVQSEPAAGLPGPGEAGGCAGTDDPSVEVTGQGPLKADEPTSERTAGSSDRLAGQEDV